jgi:adenylate kinase family enzyme
MTGEPKIYIFGAACSGVTSLGRALAHRLDLTHADVDDYFWMPTDPPYRTKRPSPERVPLIRAVLGTGAWVLTGAFDGWGDDLIEQVDLIVFLTTPTPVRMSRLAARESRRFGARIAPGGDMHMTHCAFRHWASQYDVPGFMGRSRQRHEYWLAEQVRPIFRLEGTTPLDSLVEAVLAALAAGTPGSQAAPAHPFPS